MSGMRSAVSVVFVGVVVGAGVGVVVGVGGCGDTRTLWQTQLRYSHLGQLMS